MTRKDEPMSEHTPGPWTIRDRDGCGDNIFGPGNERIANTYGDGDKWAANARLITAAPQLLAACKRFAAAMRSGDKPEFLELINTLHEADAAISAAEGS